MYSRHRWCSSVHPISSAKREMPMTFAGSRCLVRKSQQALATSSIWYLGVYRREGQKSSPWTQASVCIQHPLIFSPPHKRFSFIAFTSLQLKEHEAHTSLPLWCERCRQSRWVSRPPRGTRRAGWPLRRCTPWSLWWTWLWNTGYMRPAPACAPETKRLMVMKHGVGGQSLNKTAVVLWFVK